MMELSKELNDAYKAISEETGIPVKKLEDGTDVEDLMEPNIYLIYNDQFVLEGHNYYLSFYTNDENYHSISLGFNFDESSKDYIEMVKAIEEFGELFNISFLTEGIDDNDSLVHLTFDDLSRNPINVYEYIKNCFKIMNHPYAKSKIQKIVSLLK